jgi:hypothetical protein
MHNILFTVILLLSFLTQGQEDISIESLWSIPSEGISAFDIDEQGNCILAKKNSLYKYNDQGKLIFQESQKSIGSIDIIDARNPMKIGIFSSEQQLVQFCDNTITFLDGKLQLDEYGINTATAFSNSDQNNKCWIYDQSNSKLNLLALNSQQQQIVENLKGLLGFHEVSKIIESENNIYLIDYKTGVYKLNNFGVLINFYNIQDSEKVSIDHEQIYFIRNKTLFMYDFKTDLEKKVVDFSFQPIDFKKTGNIIYVLSPSKLSKLSLHN